MKKGLTEIFNPPKEFILNDRQLCDLELLLNGAFAPLKGFMCQKDYISVVENSRLSDGTIWPIPIVLSVTHDEFTSLDDVVRDEQINREINLIVQKHNVKRIVAKLNVHEIYEPDLDWECFNVFGTTDINHPYVKYINNNRNVLYIGGNITKVEGIEHYDFYKYRMTPAQTREKIKALKWDTIVGFQTRNPMHNCHYTLSKYALNQSPVRGDGKKGLLLQPIVGVTQENDVAYNIRVRCYKHLLKKYALENIDVMLCLVPLSMRMAGPREALWHALIRKNYGCTDFVVGRDHAGPSTKNKFGESFYRSYEAHDYINRFRDEISINIIKSQMLVYSETLDCYVPIDECPDTKYKQLSGTELRRKLVARENIPEWFTMPEISKELENAYSKRKQGLCIYLIGLSGAGKTTIAHALHDRLSEKYHQDDITILDGDIIRENLGQGLTFSREDRSINVRRIGYVASLIVKAGGIVICANIAPYNDDRLHNRKIIESLGGKYVEVYVGTGIDVCEKRDVKGLYKQARSGVIQQFTGISDPFEYPTHCDLMVSGEGDLNRILDQIEYTLL